MEEGFVMGEDAITDETIETETKLEHIRWKNRRRMAWIALFYMMIKTLLILFVVDAERLAVLTEPLTWSYFCASAIVGAYMGAATFEHIKRK
jgi:hypothetical protein